MLRVVVLTARQRYPPEDMARLIEDEGLTSQWATGLHSPSLGRHDVNPDAVLLDMDSLDGLQAQEWASQCRQRRLPVVGILPAEELDRCDPSLSLDDLVIYPCRRGELLLRVRQAIHKVKGPITHHVIKVGDLTIDQERYEVSVAGRRVLLTYKEYQLLVLLASNPGRVYGREALLEQVWGYDYFGGTRTVDVHIRRLRSKIEDANHSFIETIWNVGYRFKI